MRLLKWWFSSVRAAVVGRPKAPSQDMLDELEHRRTVNAAAAARRATGAAAVAALLDGRGRWLPRRPDWLS
jgi:hypothetical protein